MPGDLNDIVANALLDLVFGKVTYTPPVTWYAALFTGTPTNAGGGTEVASAGAYARVAIPNNTTNFPAAAGRTKSNGTLIAFPAPTAAWGIVTGMGLMTASTAGTMGAWAPLNQSRSPVVGDPAPNFPANSLTFTFV